jgi:hypothetical protein
LDQVDHEDQNDPELDDAAVDDRGGERSQLRGPGSLMSVKIRKRSTPIPGAVAPTAESSSRAAPQPAEPAPAPKTDTNAPAAATDAKTDQTSDRISRVTRRAQSERAARPAHTAAPARPARPPVSQREPVHHNPQGQAEMDLDAAQEESQAPKRKRDIVAYWSGLRAGRRLPKGSDIDSGLVAEHWPNSILIRCRKGSRALEPVKVFAAGEGGGTGLQGLRSNGRVNLSPMMLQWLLGLAGEVVKECRPMNDVETFPSVNRVVHYRAVALPFSDDDNVVDHVLCHVNPEA